MRHDVKRLSPMETITAYRPPVLTCAFSSDSTELFYVGERLDDAWVTVVRCADWRMLGGARAAGRSCSCAFDPRGARFATVHETGMVKIWDTEERWDQDKYYLRLRMDFFGGNDAVLSCAYSPPEVELLAVGGRDGSVRLYETRGHHRVRVIEAGRNAVTGLSFSHDGRLLASVGGDDPAARVWDVETGTVAFEVPAGAETGRAVFSPVEPLLLAGGDAAGYALYRGPGWRRERAELQAPPGGAGPCAFSPRGDLIALTGGETAWLSDTRSGVRLAEARLAGRPHCCVFSPDGRKLAFCGSHDAVEVFRIADVRRADDVAG